MTKITTRQESKIETIQKILHTTAKMVERDGYNKITTTKIANEANISVGIIYKYFPQGKSSIVKNIFKNGVIDLIDEEILTDLNKDDFPSFIKRIISQFVSQHRQNESLLKAMTITVLTSEEETKDIPLLNQAEFVRVQQLISTVQEFGLFKDQNSKKTGSALLKVIDSLVHTHIVFEEIFESDASMIDFLTELVIKAADFTTLKQNFTESTN
jgi:AcrR family transcriptional regulator